MTSSASTSSASKIRRTEEPSSDVPGPSDGPSSPEAPQSSEGIGVDTPDHAGSSPDSPNCHQCYRIDPDFIHKSGSDMCIACQLAHGCHACGNLECYRTNPECRYKGKAVENHVDATQTGESAPDIFDRSPVQFSAPDEVTGRVTLELTFQNRELKLWKGSASGQQNNCLIHTLMQAVFDPEIPDVADIPWVRERLQERFPKVGRSRVTANNFLDLKEHWAAVIDLIGECARVRGFKDHERIRASNVVIVGISQEEKRIVAKEGSGNMPLFVLNQSQCHFVPLLRIFELNQATLDSC